MASAKPDEIKQLREQAKQGKPQAQYLLALKLADGDGVKENTPEAMLWYQQAADNGFAPAQNNLAVLLADGHEAKSPKKSLAEKMKGFPKVQL